MTFGGGSILSNSRNAEALLRRTKRERLAGRAASSGNASLIATFCSCFLMHRVQILLLTLPRTNTHTHVNAKSCIQVTSLHYTAIIGGISVVWTNSNRQNIDFSWWSGSCKRCKSCKRLHVHAEKAYSFFAARP